ncbi:MAG: hypothetical protein GXP59_08885 [Deltaproteobacteria bacterium]|nr:hypothetical protein [Deltaproteobacteria bacterium]
MGRNSALAILGVVISLAATFFLAYSAWIFTGRYSDYELQGKRLRIADLAVNHAREKQHLVRKYNLIMADFAKFSSQVKHFGVGPGRWQTYDVNLDKILPLTEAGHLIAQLSSGPNFYFQPLSLSLGTGDYIKAAPITTANSSPQTAAESPPSPPAPPSSSSRKIHAGDVFLRVQGKFIVRDKQ